MMLCYNIMHIIQMLHYNIVYIIQDAPLYSNMYITIIDRSWMTCYGDETVKHDIEATCAKLMFDDFIGAEDRVRVSCRGTQGTSEGVDSAEPGCNLS